jgi:flagellin
MSLTLGGSANQRSLAYLSATKSKMDKSLERIASGKKLLSAADDPGGLAVAMKLRNQITTNDAELSAVENAKSYVESQSTALQTTSSIVGEMRTLKSNWDIADAAGDTDLKDSYQRQFEDLQGQLNSIKGETLNGRKLFDRGASESQIMVSNVALNDLGLDAALQNDDGSGAGNQNIADSSITLTNVTEDNLEVIEDNVSALTAEVAGDASTLGFASDYLTNMSTNLETAHGRIMDVDLAEETSNYATLSMQYEAAAAAVAQANVSSAKVLDLLLSSINRD